MTDDNLNEQFLNILNENIGTLLKISRAYAETFHDREDLVNDIVLELWKSFKSFKGDSKISTWIYRVALNTSMNFKRKKRNKSSFYFFADLKQIENIYVPELDNLSELEFLYRCIDRLDKINKAIILLYLDGNSHEEISSVTGISKTNVGTRIGRIKEQLRSISISKF